MKKLFFLLFILLPGVVSSEPTLIVDIQEEGRAKITYETEPQNISNLTRMMRSPMVQAVVGERMAALFCWAAEDFLIIPREDRITILVDCGEFARKRGWVWETEPKNLTKIKPLTITINLPDGAQLLSAEPEAHEVRDGSLVWRRVTYLPRVVYREEGFPMGYLLPGMLGPPGHCPAPMDKEVAPYVAFSLSGSILLMSIRISSLPSILPTPLTNSLSPPTGGGEMLSSGT